MLLNPARRANQNQWLSIYSLPCSTYVPETTLEYLTSDDLWVKPEKQNKTNHKTTFMLTHHFTLPSFFFSALLIQISDLLIFIYNSKLKCRYFVKNLHYINQQPVFQCTVSIYQLSSSHLERNYNGKHQKFISSMKREMNHNYLKNLKIFMNTYLLSTHISIRNTYKTNFSIL